MLKTCWSSSLRLSLCLSLILRTQAFSYSVPTLFSSPILSSFNPKTHALPDAPLRSSSGRVCLALQGCRDGSKDEALANRGSEEVNSWGTEGRRSLLSKAGAVAMSFALSSQGAEAFENRIGNLFPQLKGKPYGYTTPQPSGVGEGGVLRGCPSSDEELARPPPNCFSSSTDLKDKEHYITPFKFTKSKEEAMKDLKEGIKTYPPGQSGIDGGGWKIFKETEDYIYAQYESEKIGYLDDLEFLLNPDDKTVSVRSASRVGFLDFAVNAKRVNWFVKFLEGKGGWKAESITPDNHPDYFSQNGSD